MWTLPQTFRNYIKKKEKNIITIQWIVKEETILKIEIEIEEEKKEKQGPSPILKIVKQEEKENSEPNPI